MHAWVYCILLLITELETCKEGWLIRIESDPQGRSSSKVNDPLLYFLHLSSRPFFVLFPIARMLGCTFTFRINLIFFCKFMNNLCMRLPHCVGLFVWQTAIYHALRLNNWSALRCWTVSRSDYNYYLSNSKRSFSGKHGHGTELTNASGLHRVNSTNMQWRIQTDGQPMHPQQPILIWKYDLLQWNSSHEETNFKKPVFCFYGIAL